MSEIEQRSDEWFKVRLGKVTASRIADVIAEVKTGEAAARADYRVELICERMTGQQSEGFTNVHIERGIELEPFARAAYEAKNNLFVTQIGFAQHPTIEMSGASPDGLIGDDGMLEIKCPKAKTHINTMLDGRVPKKYIPQMQWQMACTGRKWNDFVSYCPELPADLQLFVTRLERDDDYIAELEQKVTTFLHEVSITMERLEGVANGASV